MERRWPSEDVANAVDDRQAGLPLHSKSPICFSSFLLVGLSRRGCTAGVRRCMCVASVVFRHAGCPGDGPGAAITLAGLFCGPGSLGDTACTQAKQSKITGPGLYTKTPRATVACNLTIASSFSQHFTLPRLSPPSPFSALPARLCFFIEYPFIERPPCWHCRAFSLRRIHSNSNSLDPSSSHHEGNFCLFSGCKHNSNCLISTRRCIRLEPTYLAKQPFGGPTPPRHSPRSRPLSSSPSHFLCERLHATLWNTIAGAAEDKPKRSNGAFFQELAL